MSRKNNKDNKKEQKQIRTVPALLIGAAVVMAITAFGMWFEKYNGVFRANWGFFLPRNTTQIWEKTAEASPHGDGDRYRAFKFDSEDSTVNGEAMKKFVKNGKLQYTKTQGDYDQVNEVMANYQVPDEYRPDMGTADVYKLRQDDDTLFAIYDKRGFFYIIERFM